MAENENTEIIEAQIVENKNTKSNSKQNLKGLLVVALIDILMFTLGVTLLMWADSVVNGISIAIGSIFILYATYNFIAFYRSERNTSDFTRIIAGLAMIIAGIFLITQTTFIKEIISFVVGISIIIESMVRLQDAFKLRKLNKEAAKLPLILSGTSLACGVLCIMGKLLIPDIFLQVLGVMLIIFSLTDIFSLITIYKK